jgi:carbon-monoxide dehydrogenase medium subunit
MKAPGFDYVAPGRIEDVLALLADDSIDSRILAGGQSLLPMLALRLLAPARLIDIGRIGALAGIEDVGDSLIIGALTRHAAIETSPVLAAAAPLLSAAARHIAHPAIRNRGTLGGSLALADPAAEWPACAVILDATLELRSAGGARSVPAAAFFRGVYETALAPGEIIVALKVRKARAGQHFAFAELARRHGDFAIAGIAAVGQVDRGRWQALRLVFFGTGARPQAVEVPIDMARSDDLPDWAAEVARKEIEVHAHPEYGEPYKRHVAGVLARRVVAQLRQAAA